MPLLARLNVDITSLSCNPASYFFMRLSERFWKTNNVAIKFAGCHLMELEDPAIDVGGCSGFQVDGPAGAPVAVGVVCHVLKSPFSGKAVVLLY